MTYFLGKSHHICPKYSTWKLQQDLPVRKSHVRIRHQTLHQLVNELAVVRGKPAVHGIGGVRHADEIHLVAADDHADALQVENHCLVADENGRWVGSVDLNGG